VTWTVSRRIAAGFSIILSLVVVLAGIATVALDRTASAHAAAERMEQALRAPALEAESATQEATLQYQRYLLLPDDQFARGRDSALSVSRTLIEGLRDRAGREDRDAWARALALLGEWSRESQASMAASRAGAPEEALRIYTERTLPLRLELREVIRRAVAAAQARTDASVQAAEDASSEMKRILTIASVLALVIGILSAILLNRAVTAPLREATGVLASSAAEILAASTQQASSASETSAAVVQTSSTVDEVTQTSEQAAERARTVAASARVAADIGKAGRTAVDESTEAMAAVKEQVESIADNILVLAEQAQSIGEIISTVDDLADQTNLLALNAAVEAARAGEHGRGFSVVAGEIRTLADQSKQATVQVRKILGEIQRATSGAVMTSERGTQQVASASAQIGSAGETIRALAEAAAEAAQAAAQIVASAGQQAVGMTQIRQAMGNIQEATQQNLASTRQAEAAAQDLNQLGERLLALVRGDAAAPTRQSRTRRSA
jgi:methyl-accepting chemotaxis protein